MTHELELVRQFHEKFHQPVLLAPSLIPTDRSDNRYHLMHEEVQEYRSGVADEDLANIAKELADILFTTYGTILEHGLQDIMPEVFAEVCRSNMSKDYHEYKMIKGPNYSKADVKKFFHNRHLEHSERSPQYRNTRYIPQEISQSLRSFQMTNKS